MRLIHTIQIQAARDIAMKRFLFKDDLTLATVQTDSFTTEASSILIVEPAETYELSFGDVTLVRGLYLELDQDALVAINGATPFQMRKPADGSVAKLFLEAEIGQISINNPSTDTVLNGVFVCWGDPA